MCIEPVTIRTPWQDNHYHRYRITVYIIDTIK